MNFKFLKTALTSAILLVSSFVNAGIIYDVQNGTLMGASGIEINGEIYSVSFVDGSCETAYVGCDSNLFDFTTVGTAEMAFNALIDQVFLDAVSVNGVIYNFDTNFNLTNGCAYSGLCEIWVPYERVSDTNVKSVWGYNHSNEANDRIMSNNYISPISYGNTQTYMIFTDFVRMEVETVPEPSTLAIFALGIMGLASRRFKKQS